MYKILWLKGLKVSLHNKKALSTTKLNPNNISNASLKLQLWEALKYELLPNSVLLMRYFVLFSQKAKNPLEAAR